MTEQMQSQLIELCKDETMSFKDIARILDRSECNVQRWASRLGIKKKRKKSRFDYINKDFLILHYLELKKSMKTIAEENGCKPKSIEDRLIKFDIPRRPRWCNRSRKEKINPIFKKHLDEQTYINNLKPIKFLGKNKGEFQCKCGTIKIFDIYRIVYGYTKSCGCFYHRKKHDNPIWRGYKEIGYKYFNTCKNGAAKRNFLFEITIEYIWDLYIKQDKKCALSGVSLTFAMHGKDGINNTASLDRIDSSKGYIEGNVQWIHKELQWLKWDKSNEETINWCNLITDHQRAKAS